MMKVHGNHFEDEFGRCLVLRGVNLGGNSKVPFSPDGSTHLTDGFYDGEQVSFVGRPFPIDEADGHFRRLAAWGQRFVRLIVTWEAIEHAGPGIYDAEYLDYVEGIVECAADHGISLFIDPHQDVWSRWTGGDGAPLWTLKMAGFEPRNFGSSGAALLQQEMGDQYPQMQWFTNHLRLGCATMFTLFFGGDDFAPGILFDGEPAQKFLQRHYIESMKQLAGRLDQYPNVVGFGSLNEPGAGFIGISDIRERKTGMDMPGAAPTAWEAIRAGAGYPVDAAYIGVRGLGLKITGRTTLGMPGTSAWQKSRECLWRRVGVWDVVDGVPTLLRPTWFAERIGANADPAHAGSLSHKAGLSREDIVNEVYLKPFIARFASEIGRAAKDNSRFAIFIEGFQNQKDPSWQNDAPGVLVNETHWYDSMTLALKRWTGFLAYDPDEGKAIVGRRSVRAYFADALGKIKRHSREAMGDSPTIIGEFGLPFDMNGRRAFGSGNYRLHEKALSAYYDALDANILDGTLWHYSATNTHRWGDGWNGEDLSVFCLDETGGGRALAGFVRPYAMAVSGTIVEMRFNRRTREFRLVYRPDHKISAATEVYVPMLQYPHGFSLTVQGAVAQRDDVKGFSSEENCCIIKLQAANDSEKCVLTIRKN